MDELKDPESGMVDPNQNYVYNVSLSLSSMGYLQYMERMGNLLLKKKKYEKQLELAQNELNDLMETKKGWGNSSFKVERRASFCVRVVRFSLWKSARF